MMLLGGYKDFNDVALFIDSNALENWLSAENEVGRECYNPEDDYFQREQITEEDAAWRLMVDPVELDELDKVKDMVYDGVYWLLPPF